MLADLDQSWRDPTGGASALAGLGRVMDSFRLRRRVVAEHSSSSAIS
jgi:hypothetical protein